MQKNKAFVTLIVLLVVYVALSIMGITHHEMWLDEMNTWLAARDSCSFTQFLHNTAYSGRRGLWEVSLYIISCFTHNPFSVSIFSIVISSIATFLFLRYGPFSTLFKVGVIFSYFFLFEYNVISRGYNITWLLLIIFCILFTREKRNYVLLTVTLVLLANAHLFSLLLSLPLFIILVIEYNKEFPHNKKGIIACVGIFILGTTLALLAIIPPQGSTMLDHSPEGLLTLDRFSKTFSFFVKGLYPFPDVFSYYFWNSNFIIKNFKIVGIVLTPVLCVMPFILCYDKPRLLFFFYTSALLTMGALFVLKLFTGVHYMGYVFMILLTTLWLARDERLKRETRSLFLDKLRRYLYKPFICTILICQVLGALYALSADYRRPFSEGKAVASYIETSFSKQPIIISEPVYLGICIAGYMNTPVYYPDLNNFGTFWNWRGYQNINEKEILNRIKRVADSVPSGGIAITISLDYDYLDSIKANIDSTFNKGRYIIKEQKEFTDAIVRGENYVVYLVEKK